MPAAANSRLGAELYALTHRGSSGDGAFYREFCGDAAHVLELGSGYGRLLVTLARPPRVVVGLELDAELLRAARRNLRALPATKRRSVKLVRGDMQRFDLGRRFERVLLPYNGLFCLLSKRAAFDCFRSVRASLAPGGIFAFDVWNAEAFQRRKVVSSRDDSNAPSAPIVSLWHARRTWDVFEHSKVRRSRQRLDVTYTYLPREGGASLRIPIPQRYFLAPELRELLERAGFVVGETYGDFAGGRFTLRSPHLIALARAR